MNFAELLRLDRDDWKILYALESFRESTTVDEIARQTDHSSDFVRIRLDMLIGESLVGCSYDQDEEENLYAISRVGQLFFTDFQELNLGSLFPGVEAAKNEND
tara:strand:+ start:1691 stop:1999 length:309 start_codon:yes stop_codon:yes gene_type:complete